MEHPDIVVSVYPEHFIVTCDFNGNTFEGRGELLSTALFDLAEEIELDEI